MKKTNKILVIIQRSNGDVFFSLTLIKILYEYFESPQIDLLVNEDTIPIAKTFPYLRKILTFSYERKKTNRWKQEAQIISSIYRKYDLSINLTASDRSVIYSIIAGKESISAVENNLKKSWWKKLLLSHFYFFDSSRHILLNNLEPLRLLNIKHENIQETLPISENIRIKVSQLLKNNGINKFIIFHPSAQYEYKVYPKSLRDKLLISLNKLKIPVIITGSRNRLDTKIKKEIPNLENIFNFIGET